MVLDINYINTVTEKYGDFKITTHLEDNRDFCVISFNPQNADFQILDGINNKNIIEYSKQTFDFERQEIWAAYGEIDLPEINNRPIDAFYFRTDILEKNFDTELRELLIFHEIVHFIEKRNLIETFKINLENIDNLWKNIKSYS